ncbi:phosphatidylserine decarboxylase family protein [Lutibacter citreus]|uniref:phosphatidylserine decarboxylase family protein n=1 Tax=Lutibacter citreus TaxID=2138210 RepID=UPI000DBE4FBD|nr:phosphatidylserine decarboxylase family protein [Lutibacter citreus]
MFHKEGYKIILISTLIVGVGIILIENFIEINWLNKALSAVLLIMFLLILQFFRNPKRNTIIDDNSIIAPADGKVVVIEEVFEKEYFKDKRIQISIFMSPLNVHVTRYPIGGNIQFSKYHPGKFLVAWHPKSSEENERTSVVIKNNTFGEVLYRQIAGALAKRIVNYAKPELQVVQGTDAGFIKFGSRIDVFLPLNSKIEVNINDKVKGGEQIIARI